MKPIDGLLLDIDGVLATSWRALPGAIEAMASLRRDHVPFRLVTNTTTKTRADLAGTLNDAGFEIEPNEIVTAVVATAQHLRERHADAAVFVLSDGDATDDLDGVRLADVDRADVIVIGGASGDFTHQVLNEVFRRLMDGASLVGMHRNMYWKTDEGWELDSGAYIAGLEEASGRQAMICGKPTGTYFAGALAELGVPSHRAAMVGDDIANDVLGAQAHGITGVLVRTGKFREEDLAKGDPDVVLGSIADVPAWRAAE